MSTATREERYVIRTMLGVTAAFVAVVTLPLWLMGLLPVAGRLAIGFAGLWLLTWVSTLLLSLWEWTSGIGVDTHYNTYVGTNLAACVTILTVWVLYATAPTGSIELSFWKWSFVFLIRFVSAYLAFAVVTSWYAGGIYKIVCLPLAMVEFLIATIVFEVAR